MKTLLVASILILMSAASAATAGNNNGNGNGNGNIGSGFGNGFGNGSRGSGQGNGNENGPLAPGLEGQPFQFLIPRYGNAWPMPHSHDGMDLRLQQQLRMLMEQYGTHVPHGPPANPSR